MALTPEQEQQVAEKMYDLGNNIDTLSGANKQIFYTLAVYDALIQDDNRWQLSWQNGNLKATRGNTSHLLFPNSDNNTETVMRQINQAVTEQFPGALDPISFGRTYATYLLHKKGEEEKIPDEDYNNLLLQLRSDLDAFYENKKQQILQTPKGEFLSFPTDDAVATDAIRKISDSYKKQKPSLDHGRILNTFRETDFGDTPKDLVFTFNRWLSENPEKLQQKLLEKQINPSQNLTFSIEQGEEGSFLKVKQDTKEIRIDYNEAITDNMQNAVFTGREYEEACDSGDVSAWDPWGRFLNYLQTASPNESSGEALKVLFGAFFRLLADLSERFQDNRTASTFEDSLYDSHYDSFQGRPTLDAFTKDHQLSTETTTLTSNGNIPSPSFECNLIPEELDYLKQAPDAREDEAIKAALATPSPNLKIGEDGDLFITIPPFFADCGNEEEVTLHIDKTNINKPINDPLHPTESEILQNMGYTPLHIAARLGDFNMMSQLQNIGADPMIMAEPDPLKPGSPGLKPFQIAAKHVEEVSPRIRGLQEQLNASMGVPGHKKDRARWRSEINMIKNGRDLPKIQQRLKELAQVGKTTSPEYLSLKAEYDAVIARKYAKKSAKDRAELLSATAMKDKKGQPVWDGLKDANGHPVIRSDMYEANCTQSISAWSRQPYNIHNDPTSGPIENPIIVTVHEMNLSKSGYWTDYEAKKADCSKVDGNRYVTDAYKNSGALEAESGNSYQFLCDYHNKVRTGKMEPVNQANSPKAPDVSYRPGNNASKEALRYDINPPDKGEEQSSRVFHSGANNTNTK